MHLPPPYPQQGRGSFTVLRRSSTHPATRLRQVQDDRYVDRAISAHALRGMGSAVARAKARRISQPLAQPGETGYQRERRPRRCPISGSASKTSACCNGRLRGREIVLPPGPLAEPGASLFDAPSRVVVAVKHVGPDLRFSEACKQLTIWYLRTLSQRAVSVPILFVSVSVDETKA